MIKPWNEREDDTRYADSGVDDQLVIHVPFSQNVRVRSILLKLGELMPIQHRTRTHRVFVNRSGRAYASSPSNIRKSS